MGTTGVVTEIVLKASEARAPRFTPRELRMIKDATGRTFSQVLADDESDDKFVVLAWLRLRRDGHDLEWSDMDDIVVQLLPDEDAAPVDPTNGQRPATSPASAATGG